MRLSTPYGTFAPGDALPDGSTLVVQIVADPNADPQHPGSDPDPNHPRTYQVQFFKQIPDPAARAGARGVPADRRAAPTR